MNSRPRIRAVILLAMLTVVGCGGNGDDSPAPSIKSTGQPGRFDGPVTALVSAPDQSGDVYVAGAFTTYNDQPVRPVVRLRSNGTLNDTFILSSQVVTGAPVQLDVIAGIAAADDGSQDLYVGEFIQNQGGQSGVGRLWRVNPDGSLESSFVTGEMELASGLSPTGLPMRLHAVVPVGDGSGRVYAGGVFDRYNDATVANIVRVNPNGSLDGTFANTSTTTAFVLAPAKDGTGDLYVATFQQVSPSAFRSQGLIRLNQDGTVDPAFNSGVGISPPSNPTDGILTVVPVEDGTGDIFVGGNFRVWGDPDPFGPNAVPGLARVNPDGTLDRTDPTPAIPAPVPDTPGVTAIAKAVDGPDDWFVASSSQLGRFKPDGSPDPGFTVGQANVLSLLPLPDGTSDLYAGGNFTLYNGMNVGNLVRLNANGSLD